MTDMTQHGPVRVRADDVSVGEQHAAQRALHVPGYGLVGHGLLEASTLSEHSNDLNQIVCTQSSKIRKALAEVLPAHKSPGCLDDRLAAPQTVLRGEQIRVATPARHRERRRADDGGGLRVGRTTQGAPRVGCRMLLVDVVLELVAGHQTSTPLLVIQIRLPLETEHAVTVRKRNWVEGAPETGREHTDGLGPRGHDNTERTIRSELPVGGAGTRAAAAATATTAAAAAAVDIHTRRIAPTTACRERRSNTRRRTSRLNLLFRLLQPLFDGFHPARAFLRGFLSLFRGLSRAPSEIVTLVGLPSRHLPHACFHLAFLQYKHLRLLHANQHLLPRPIQVHHLIVLDGSAVLTLLSGCSFHSLRILALVIIRPAARNRTRALVRLARRVPGSLYAVRFRLP